MSAAVDADLARLYRELDRDQEREEAIERLASDYRSDAAKLGEAATWIEGSSVEHRRIRIHIGSLIRAALEYASGHGSAIGALCTLTHAGQVLSNEPALQDALFKLAERQVAEDETCAAEYDADCRADR